MLRLSQTEIRNNAVAFFDAYNGKRKFKNELERLEFLFDLYRQYTEPLAMLEKKKPAKHGGESVKITTGGKLTGRIKN